MKLSFDIYYYLPHPPPVLPVTCDKNDNIVRNKDKTSLIGKSS